MPSGTSSCVFLLLGGVRGALVVFRWTASVFKGSWELFRVHPHLRICDTQMWRKMSNSH